MQQVLNNSLDFSWLENLIINHACLVDTSALMSDGAEVFFCKIIAPILLRNSKKLIVPYVVITELENNKKKADRKQNAERGLKILNELHEHGLVNVKGEQTDTHPDQVFRRVYAQHCTSKNLLFITNDRKLAKEICGMHNSESVKTRHSLIILEVLPNGMPRKLCENGRIREAHKPKMKKLESMGVNSESLDKLMSVRIKPAEFPSVGSRLYLSSGEPIILTEKVAEGGEGSIYKTDRANILAKIYAEDRLTKYREYKVKRMVELEIKKSKNFAIAWPIDIVRTADGSFVGFIMDEVKGKKLQDIVFTPLNAKNYGLSRKDLVEISLNLLKAFRYIHMKGIIIGDINPQNILIDTTRNNFVSIIDTDSFQFDIFKCEVGTLEFTRPSLLRENVNFREYTRVPMDEAFAVAVMIFRILMLGKHPFSYKGGEDIIENMKKGNFPYKLQTVETSTEDAPIGPWKYIWSHIIPPLREALGRVILEEVEIKSMQALVSYESDLIKLLESYKDGIQKGTSTNELTPYYIYISDKIPKVKVACSSCGYEFEMAENYYMNLVSKKKQIYCGKCLQAHRLRNLSKTHQKSNNHTSKPSTSTSLYTQTTAFSRRTSQESFLSKLLRILFE